METDRQQVVNSGPWAACFARAEASAIASLRLHAGVQGCIADDRIWLRGNSLSESLDQILRRLAPTQRYTIAADDALVPLGNLLPTSQLPQGEWQPLSKLVEVRRTAAALAGAAPTGVPIRIVRSTRPKTATMLMSSLADWGQYADAAPAIRLAPLRFAATRDHALICGDPLPPIPGVRLYEVSGVAVPCGFEWSPAIDAGSLRKSLSLQGSDMAIFFENGSWELLPDECFVQARRSAVRLTIKGVSQ